MTREREPWFADLRRKGWPYFLWVRDASSDWSARIPVGMVNES